MKIHYFQRYHQKENVATANTMLLLSRLYSYSSNKFFTFLKELCFNNNVENEVNLELNFTIQEKSKDSVPDATIAQESFKIVVETKITDWFHEDQLENHLKAFENQKYKILLTLASEPMNNEKKEEFEKKLEIYNKKPNNTSVIHVNTTL